MSVDTIEKGVLDDEGVQIPEVIKQIKAKGFTTTGKFILSFLSNQSLAVKRKSGKFLGHDGEFVQVVGMILRQSQLSPEGKYSSSEQALQDVRAGLGEDIIEWFLRLLNADIRELCEDSGFRLPPNELTPQKAEEFDFRKIELMIQEKAPLFFRVIRRLCLVEGEKGVIVRKRKMREFEEKEESDTSEDSGTDVEDRISVEGARDKRQKKEDGPGVLIAVKQQQKIRGRNKGLIATMVIGQMTYARTNRCNWIQTMMGCYLSASRVPKSAVGVLNQLGVSIAYPTIVKANLACASSSDRSFQIAVKSGMPFGVFWDNMTIYQRVGEQTVSNYNTFLNWTARGAWEVQKATKVPLEWEKVHNVNCGLLREPKKQVSKSEELAYDVNSDGIQVKPGLDKASLIAECPDYQNIDICQLLDLEGLELYMRESHRGILGEVLWKHLRGSAGSKVVLPNMPELHCLEPKRARIWTLPTLEVDESTLDGNAEILEEFARSAGLDLRDLEGRAVLVAGDLMSTSRANGVKVLRVRDYPHQRMDWAITIDGILHVTMCATSAVLECNMGRKDGRDPCSFNKFAGLLGRGRLMETKNAKDFSAQHRLVMGAFESLVLAAAVEITGSDGLNGLKKWASKNSDWNALIDEIAEEYLPMRKVGELRSEATRVAGDRKRDEWEEEDKRIQMNTQEMGRGRGRSRGGRGGRGGKSESRTKRGGLKWRNEQIEKEAWKARDLGYENTLLMFQHCFIYYDLFTAMRKGDTGCLEKCLDLFCVIFHGAGKWKYARELLEFVIDRRFVWSDEMRGLWLENILLNLSGKPGKFMGIDEMNEYVVREQKDCYNPKHNIQSKEYHLGTVARNIMTFRNAKRTILRSTGAPLCGGHHSRVDDSKDIELLVETLINSEAMVFKSKRQNKAGTAANPVQIKEATDAWSLGMKVLCGGSPLDVVISKRTKRVPNVTEKQLSTLESGDDIVFIGGVELNGDEEGDT
ncbi:hypothetical protein BDZ91DRAFT_848070 [Kalaharituber pfeilii]|nr:hypothetical protein BDZ91DRAFT_848070 [Kalaharituber pfeilii]